MMGRRSRRESFRQGWFFDCKCCRCCGWFHLHFDLVSSVLALDATEKVSQTVSEMAVELINNHLISLKEIRDT